MRRFFTPDRTWPCRQLPHLYYLPHPDDLAPLLDDYDPILATEPAVTVVPRQWLHATLLKITPVTHPIPWDHLTHQLHQHLTDHAPIELVAGPALVGTSSVVLDLTPDTAWNRLRTLTTTIVNEVLGAGSASTTTTERPHITLAYGIADTDSATLQSRLRRATDQRCPLTVTHIDAVNVTQDLITHSYHWGATTTITLASTSPPQPQRPGTLGPTAE